MFRLRPVLNAVKNMQSVAFMRDSVKTMTTTTLNIPEVPDYNINKPQTLEIRKARLLYQSRKRGMLENDLILSTFVKQYLDSLTEEQTIMYDRLINGPFSDWDIYYWIVEKQPTPKEYDNEIMDMLKKHAKNEERVILSQPDLS